jgi:hypothetical protein
MNGIFYLVGLVVLALIIVYALHWLTWPDPIALI